MLFILKNYRLIIVD